MSGLLNGKQLKDKSVPAEKLTDVYLPVEGGTITGDLTVSGNTTLTGKATYKGSEIATVVDLYDDTQIKELIGDLKERKAGKDEIITITDGQGNKFLSDDGTYKSIVENLHISLSDQILSKDIAGLKANLSVAVEGNDIKILGKDDSEGNPIVIAEFNVLQARIVDRVEIVAGHLFLTFIVDNEGTPGTETVDIDLSGLIDIYVGSTYIKVEGNIISLNYNTLRDRLTGEGFAKKSAIPQIPTQLPNPSAITFTGVASGVYDGSVPVTVNIPATDLSGHVPTSRTVWGKSLTTNVTGDISGTGNIYTSSTNTSNIGSSTLRYKDVYARNAWFAGTVTAPGGLLGNATTATTAGKVQNELQFTGAVSASYNGSGPVTIDASWGVFITFHSVFGIGDLSGDVSIFNGAKRAYDNHLPLFILSKSEKGIFPVISRMTRTSYGYIFAIMTKAEPDKLYISIVEVDPTTHYSIKPYILPLNSPGTTPLRSVAVDSPFETVVDPSEVKLNKITDLRYENKEDVTGTLAISGGEEGMEYIFTLFNNSKKEYTLFLPSGDIYVTNNIEKTSVAPGCIGTITIRYISGKYFLHII